MSPPAYRLRDVTFAYGETTVLHVPELEVACGEVTAIVGANGAGKTTLLKLLGFLALPTTGSLCCMGEVPAPNALGALRRRIGFLLQDPYLFRGSALYNVEWGLHLRGIRGKESRRRAEAAIATVGLRDVEHRSSAKLSGGQMRRLALARVLALEADVLLLDEPLAHMDRVSARQTATLIRQLNRDRGTTVVLASHDLLQAQSLADQVVRLHEGHLLPLWQANILAGRTSADGCRFQTDHLTIHVEGPPTEGTRLAVDPAAIQLSKTRPPDGRPNTFPGRVTALSEQADAVRVRVDARDPFDVLMAPAAFRESGLRLGDSVYLSFDPAAAKVF